MIEKMERMTLFGLSSDSHSMITRIMECGCVQIEDPAQAPQYEELKEITRRKAVDVYASEQLQNRLGQALKLLAPYGKKRGLLDPRGTASFADMCGEDSQRKAEEICESIETIQREMGFLKGEVAKQEFLLSSLEPWRELDQPLEESETKTCALLLAALPLSVTLEETVDEAAAQGLAAYITQAGEDTRQRYLAAVALRADIPALWEILRQKGGTRNTFPGLRGTPAENMAACRGQIEALGRSQKSSQEMLAGFAGEISLLQEAYDSTQMRIDRAKARQNMLHTDNTFFLQAWVPVVSKVLLIQSLEPFTCHYEFAEPAEGEEAPILLKNNKFVQPFETITEMYSMPVYDSIDPGGVVALFYAVFFGMMLSDAGYGLLLAFVGFWGAKKFNMGPGAKKMLRMFGFCGLSTIFWGLAYGSFFGNIIPTIATVFFGRTIDVPVLLDPLKDPIALLLLSFVMGYIQILTGLGMKAVIMIKRRHLLDAVLDVGIWCVVLIGLPLMAMGMFLGGSLSLLGTIGMWMSVGGAAGLILTQGRSNKNPVMKLLSGIMSLYDIVGYFSDLLSYSRIMALGLATAVIGQVVNMLGTISGVNVAGVIMLVLVFPIGHGLNMAINTLGSYVHTSRLQYVEFFGKFFEVGGKAFTPLRANTKYINIIKQEEN